LAGRESTAASCDSCHASLRDRAAFVLRASKGQLVKCTKCALLDGRLFRRSGALALIVGTALAALNHGDRIVADTFPWSTSWHKVALTYVVPFCVATYGALANGYTKAPINEKPLADSPVRNTKAD
jgi:hypothetical protein